MDPVVVLITAGSNDEAKKIAHDLVERNLVACVNILPGVRSVFRWEGKIAEEHECLLMAKTVEKSFKMVVEAVKALHSYSVPEVIALPIKDGLPEYLRWIGDSTRQAS